jgi:glycosyltransferase involved in cell wall biosynthesis
LHPLKGLDLLVAAWAEVKKCANARMRECANDSSWQLVIAGPDEQGTKEKLIRLCQGFHLRGAYGGQDGGQEGISESSFADTASTSAKATADETEDKKLKLKWCECAGMDDREEDADVVFLGAVHGEEKWALMQRADIFVLPSRSENFGIVVGEALSCGVPVVTTAVGPWGESEEMRECSTAGIGEWGRDAEPGEVRGQRSEVSGNGGETPRQGEADPKPVLMENRGLIVVETSVEGIAEGLRQMMALSDAERKEMGRQGCEWVKREFSWENVAKQMVAAYGVAAR